MNSAALSVFRSLKVIEMDCKKNSSLQLYVLSSVEQFFSCVGLNIAGKGARVRMDGRENG